jgi:hypothetical protein
MRYTLIAAALIGAVVAMPAVPASYGEAPAAYNAPDSYGSENVYGTEVSNKPTTAAAALPSSTCTDEAENVVPYTTPAAQSQVVESSAPGYGVPSKSEEESVPAMQTNVASSSEVSPGKPAETPAGYASKPAMSAPAASSSESSPEMPAETPAGYMSKPADVASSTEVSPMSPKETESAPAGYQSMPVESAPAGYAASSAVPKSPEASMPAEGTESSPEMPAQYGSTIAPGAAPTAAPYPQSGNEASPVTPGKAAASGTAGAAMPTGTGSVGGTQEFEGAASSLSVAGLFVSFGAIAALFM